MNDDELQAIIIPPYISAIVLDAPKAIASLSEENIGPSFPASRLDERNTLLHLAAMCCGPEAVAELLKAGADPTIKNDSGKTPADLAFREDVRHVLLEAVDARARLNSAFARQSWTSRCNSNTTGHERPIKR